VGSIGFRWSAWSTYAGTIDGIEDLMAEFGSRSNKPHGILRPIAQISSTTVYASCNAAMEFNAFRLAKI
jgi:hypothetical protein